MSVSIAVRWSMILFVMTACKSDKDNDTATDDATSTEGYLEPPPEGEGFQISMTATAPAYSEVWLCDVGSLPNEEYASINWVEVLQNDGTHHMTLSTLGLTPSGAVEPGRYDCADLYGNSSLMTDQIMFYGNQGVASEVMNLPEGVAATFPPNLDLIHEIHYVNTTDEDIELYSHVNAWTIPNDEVDEGIWGGQVRDETIDIPANSTHSEWSRCVMNEDVEVLFLASHTHQLGVEFTIAPFDGKNTEEVIYTNTDWHVPLITQYDPPLSVPAGTGFEWTCTWTNPTDQPVSYGSTAEDEMCNLALVHTPFSMSAKCEVVETSDGVLWSDD